MFATFNGLSTPSVTFCFNAYSVNKAVSFLSCPVEGFSGLGEDSVFNCIFFFFFGTI